MSARLIKIFIATPSLLYARLHNFALFAFTQSPVVFLFYLDTRRVAFALFLGPHRLVFEQKPSPLNIPEDYSSFISPAFHVTTRKYTNDGHPIFFSRFGRKRRFFARVFDGNKLTAIFISFKTG